MSTQYATFGAGCFWGVEEAFRTVPGVKSTEVGFMGGHTTDPSYKEVCAGDTGHAEVVHIEYDENETSYEKLLTIFWDLHDPTQMNRQGPDVGYQYRSVIFYHTEEQHQQAVASKEALSSSGKYSKPIVTAIEPAGTFYKAEEYHQKYFLKNGGGACHI